MCYYIMWLLLQKKHISISEDIEDQKYVFKPQSNTISIVLDLYVNFIVIIIWGLIKDIANKLLASINAIKCLW